MQYKDIPMASGDKHISKSCKKINTTQSNGYFELSENKSQDVKLQLLLSKFSSFLSISLEYSNFNLHNFRNYSVVSCKHIRSSVLHTIF